MLIDFWGGVWRVGIGEVYFSRGIWDYVSKIGSEDFRVGRDFRDVWTGGIGKMDSYGERSFEAWNVDIQKGFCAVRYRGEVESRIVPSLFIKLRRFVRIYGW